MSNFWKRFFAGFVFIVLVLGSLLLGHWSFTLFFTVIVVLASLEFSKLLNKTGQHSVSSLNAILASFVFLWGHALSEGSVDFKTGLSLIPLSGILLWLFSLYGKLKGFQVLSSALVSLLYIAIPFTLLHCLLFDITPPVIETYHPGLIILLFFMVWFNDSWAYISGKALGKHKLFPSVSPKKTWEGLIGGMLVTLLFSFIVSLYYTDYTQWDILIMGLLMVIFGSIGDLIQSKLKRLADQKDSGNIIPGHGGILDRLDAFIFGVPAVCTYLFFQYYL